MFSYYEKDINYLRVIKFTFLHEPGYPKINVIFVSSHTKCVMTVFRSVRTVPKIISNPGSFPKMVLIKSENRPKNNRKKDAHYFENKTTEGAAAT